MTEVVEVPGPWEHRTVSARGARFHVVAAGDGPLVLFLHGFPQFWWAWRHQIPAFAGSGYRAVALDLRGVGGSDHSPRGYDLPALAEDVEAVIRSLGATDAVVVGHDWGGLVAWTLAALHPEVVHRLVAVSAAHPRRLRQATLTSPGQVAALGVAWRMQAPWIPERKLVEDDAAYVGELITSWWGPGRPDPEALSRYRAAMQVGNTAYCTAEYHRWAVRSLVRPDGMRFASRMSRPVTAPVLHVHGAADSFLLTDTVLGSDAYVEGPYRWELIPDVGHFPHEEAPDQLSRLVLDWLDEVEPELA